jgi:putative multiple sugar transport system ATP-binding protein
VLRDGATVATRDARAGEVSEAQIVRDMVGRDMAHRYPERTPKIGETLLEVADWTVWHPEHAGRKVIKGVNLRVAAGEVVGIAGVMGSGRTEFAMSLFGRSYGRNVTGSVRLKGREIDTSTVRAAVDNGLAYVTEDRKGLGLVLEETVLRNITLANLGGVAKGSVIDRSEERQVGERFRRALNIRTPSVFQKAMNLSGGNQQKVVLSKWLFSEPEVLILDEPTRGIDVGAKFEIYGIINKLADEGKGIVMISSEMPELLGMCDRIYVMNEGVFVGELAAADASQEIIMSMIVRA